MKSIINLSFVGALLLLFGAAGFLVDAMFLVPAAGALLFVPEALSEIG
jgi:hypothetical protein